MGVLFSIVALFVTYECARRSLVKGIFSALAFGYAFGIVRANFPEIASYFIFDAAVLGLYAAQWKVITRPFLTEDGQRLKHWVTFLMMWPLLLFFLPQQDAVVQMIGLRGNVFLLPFLLIGAQLEREEIYQVGLSMAVLNLTAFAFGVSEYILGLEHFFPHNPITQMIYASNDVGSLGAYRIPGVFANGHCYGGMMVISLPWIVGAWVQRHREIWHKNVLLAGLLAAMFGVFMSAARSHFIVLLVLITVFTFSSRLRPIYRVGWLVILILVGYVVVSNERMQRFKTLGDQEFVSARLESSVNVTLLEAVTTFPFGNGLGGGGTSIPYFLQDRVDEPVVVESEIGRIHLETGLVGMAAWVVFVLWIFTRPRPNRGDSWFLGVRLAWFAALTFCSLGLIGIGLLTTIPSSAVFLMSMGWIATHQSKQNAALSRFWRAARSNPRLLWALRQRGVVPS